MASVLDAIPLLSSPRGFSGHMEEFGRDRFAFLRRATNEIGPVGRLRFSTRDIVIANTAETVHEVLVEKARDYEKSPMIRLILHPLAGEGLFTSGGALWRKQRKLMAPVFHHAKIDAFAEQMVECASRVCEEFRDGQELDVAHETTRIAMSVAGRTLFGFDTFDEADEVGHALTVALRWADEASTRIDVALQVELRLWLLGLTAKSPAVRSRFERWLERLEAPIFWPTRRDRELRRAIALLDAQVQKMIETRRADGTTREDLLSHLLHARDVDSGGVMDDKQLRDEILTLFVAGHETTANGLAWAIYLLARHPEVYARARAAVDALSGRAPTLADLPALELLTRSFKEALRLYPPVYLFARITTADTILGGYAVPARTIVIISPFMLHHRADLWSGPDRFDPDRFLPERESKRHRDAFIPFSDGPRVCIGAHFAQLEAPLVLARMLQRADFELTSRAEIGPDESGTLRPKGGVPVRIRLRTAGERAA